MSNLFSINGPLYKFCTVVYNLLVLNFLWVVFSIPLFTIGASTTALFYAAGKIIRDKNYSSLSHEFWKSFKQNFKQATVIWLILICLFSFVMINIWYVNKLGSFAIFLTILQYIFLLEVVMISIYIFPLLSRYHLKIVEGFKSAFFIANRHLITSILCLAVFPGLYFLITWKGVFILLTMGIYSYWITYLIKNRIERYESAD